jgi:hypothetical protein
MLRRTYAYDTANIQVDCNFHLFGFHAVGIFLYFYFGCSHFYVAVRKDVYGTSGKTYLVAYGATNKT